MGTKQEFEKYFFFMIMMGALILFANIYYYCYPLAVKMGATHQIIEELFLKLRDGGMFSTPVKTKLVALILICPCLLARTGRLKSVSVLTLVVVGCCGALLYFLPCWHQMIYLLTTLVGASMVFWTFGMMSRKSSHENLDEMESFKQCEKLIETDTSVNLPTRYVYNGRVRNGWINLVAIERGVIIMGNPGSGKSFSAFEPCIETMIRKGFSMVLYDFKFPTLTNFAYNQYLKYYNSLGIKPEFHVINMSDARTSARFNPVSARLIQYPADSAEVADILIRNMAKSSNRKEDFFTDSAKLYIDAVIWFLRCYQGGRYCTFAHVLCMLNHKYEEILEILVTVKENIPKITSFVNALEGGAGEQLQGMIGSSQTPVGKLSSPEIFWILSGDDCDLTVNDPKHPKILCIGNAIDRQEINGAVLSLYTSRIFKLINQPGRCSCGVMLDELPTIYLKGLDTMIATARSNGVATVLGIQDYSQLVRDYGEKEADVIFSNVASIISGQVSGRTAERMSKMFGKADKTKESETIGRTNDSINISRQKEEVLPVSRIETLSQGQFIGKVGDTKRNPIRRKFFCGEIYRDAEAAKEEMKHWHPLPSVRDFKEDEAEREVRSNPYKYLNQYFTRLVMDRNIGYSDDEVYEEVQKLYAATPLSDQAKLIDRFAANARDIAYRSILQDNYDRIFREVAHIIKSELERLRTLQIENDPRVYDPTYDL